MPFLLPLVGAAIGGSGLIGAGGLAAAGLGASLGSAASGLFSSSKAQNTASQAAPQINLDQLNNQISSLAKQNALASQELEKQLNPEVANLRTTANQNLLNYASGPNGLSGYEQQLAARLGHPVAGDINPALLSQAASEAGRQLSLGGALPDDVRNLIARESASRSGMISGNLGLGRDITARDLGLTSLQLLNQRLQNAAAIGGQQAGVEQFNVGTQFNNAANYNNIIQLLQNLNNARFGQNLGTAQYAQSIMQPQVGLDPSSMANIVIGNNNAQQAQRANQANVQGAQGNNLMNFAGQLFGYNQLANIYKPSTPVPSGGGMGNV